MYVIYLYVIYLKDKSIYVIYLKDKVRLLNQSIRLLNQSMDVIYLYDSLINLCDLSKG